MHTSALEESALTTPSNEPQPETPEPETTALVPTEPDVIEGEVIEIEPPEFTQDHRTLQQRPYWLLVPITILVCLSILAVSLLLPLLTPTATVLIIPREQHIATFATIQIQGRVLPALTLSSTTTVLATGHDHQDATYAEGTITFYNGLLSEQTIAAGTVLTGSDAVQVVTDHPAPIPAGNPPIYGQVTVSAHAVIPGSQGNIAAFDINTACCLTSVLAKNTEAFTGGQNARDYTVVTREDIHSSASPLQATLSQSEHAALLAQLQPNEQLITPSCTPHVSSDHKPGDEAINVTVTVSETCGGIAYAAHEVYANATQLLTSQAGSTLGANYALIGDIQITIVHATITNSHQGRAHIIVQIAGTWVYQITPPMQQHLVQLIASKTKQQAITILLHFPGIHAASIHLAAGNTTVPADPRNIQVTVVYTSV